jgi:cysteine desulfurase/selenocysteine lyase
MRARTMSQSTHETPAPRLGDRSLFPQLKAAAYLNHAAISPLAEPVRAAAQRVIDDQATLGSPAFATRLAEREALRGRLAGLLQASADEIALVPSTMYGLAAIATSLPWRPGARVILFAGEYPTNVSVWQRAAERFGLGVTLLPVSDFAHAAGPDLSALERELARGDVQLCAASLVQFQSGLRMPIERIAALCHAHGAELAVDAVQALGCLPIDVRAAGIDYLAAGSHKWLLGIDGGGVLYARSESIPKLRPALVGAMSHLDAVDLFVGPGQLRYDRALRSELRLFEGGMLSSVSFAALGAATGIIAALGPAAIEAHVQAYHDALEPGLLERGFRSLRCPDRARRSGILGVLPPPSAASSAQLAGALGARGIVCSSPDGVLRFAPHFANALDEVPGVLAALDAALRS